MKVQEDKRSNRNDGLFYLKINNLRLSLIKYTSQRYGCTNGHINENDKRLSLVDKKIDRYSNLNK